MAMSFRSTERFAACLGLHSKAEFLIHRIS